MPDRRFSLIGHAHDAVAEVNDLTAAVTWANIPNANVPQSAVTQHVAAINHDALLNFASNEHFTMASISITESQISDLNHPAADLDGISPTNLLDKSATETISGTYTFTSTSGINIGTGNSADEDVLIHFDIDRSWRFVADGVDAGSTLALRSDNDKSFWIQRSTGVGQFQFATSATAPFLRIKQANGVGYVQIDHDGTDVNITGSSAAELDFAGFTALRLKSGVTLRLDTTTDASLSSTGHGFQVGLTASNNVIIDGNEILCRNNGGTQTLNINITGGRVAFGTSGANRINLENGQITSNGFAFLHYVTTGYTSGKITVSSSTPSSPAKGDVWFDTS